MRMIQLVVNVTLEEGGWDQVSSFRYLGRLVCEDGKCDSEIWSKITIGKAAFGQIKTILTNLGIGIGTRMRQLKTYAWSVILFGCKGWTISKEMRRNLEAAEICFIRRMVRIPWTVRRTNDEVLQMAGGCRELLTVLRGRQICRFYWAHTEGKWFGERVASGYDRGKKSERKANVEVHGQYQGVCWLWMEVYHRWWGWPRIEVCGVPLQLMFTWTWLIGKVSISDTLYY